MNKIPYSSIALQSEEKIETNAWTYEFKDGRSVTVGIAADGTDQGVWVDILRPLEDGKVSELKFRLSAEGASILSQLINQVLNHKPGLENEVQ